MRRALLASALAVSFLLFAPVVHAGPLYGCCNTASDCPPTLCGAALKQCAISACSTTQDGACEYFTTSTCATPAVSTLSVALTMLLLGALGSVTILRRTERARLI